MIANLRSLTAGEFARAADLMLESPDPQILRCVGAELLNRYRRTIAIVDEMAAEMDRKDAIEPAPIVSVCAWCPDVQEQTQSARAHGFDVSHTICPACQARFEKEKADPRS
jgi:hypothetical protein